MSGRETVLVHPDGPAITVTAGTVDTFVALPSGGTIPLATVSAPCLIVAPATGPGVRVVPRIGATMSAVTGDVPVADAALAAFRTALAQAAPAEFRASSTAASLDLLPTVLASLIGVLIDQHAARGRDLAAAQRTQDTESSETAYRNAALAVTSPGTTDTVCDWDPLLSVVRAVARVEGCTVRAKPTRLRDRDPVARLHRIARSSDFGVRPIQLADNWQQPRVHALVGFQSTDSGRQAVALLPTATGYGLSTGAAAQPRRINDETARSLEPVAYQLQPRLNRLERAHTHELIRLATHKSWRDWTLVALLGLAVAILGLLTPVLTSVILGTLIPAGELGLVGQAGVALVIAAFVAGVFTYVQYRAISRFTQRTLERGQNALWDRLLSLPVSFFRRYSSGDLAMRAMALDWLAQIVNAQVIGTFLAAAFSLVNVFLMLWYDVWLGVAGLCFLILTLGATWWVVVITQRLYRESLSCQLDATSWVVQLLVGIGKIRLAGAESRVGSRYVELLRRQVAAGARMTTVMGRLFSWLAFAGAASLAVFAALILSRSGSAGPDISGPTYLAFSAAFGASFACVSALAAVVIPFAAIGPVMDLVAPIVLEPPEFATHRTDPGKLRGSIEFRQVSFRYSSNQTAVLSDVSFAAAAGEMVAIVGPSGAGKSTIARLLLGFEEPQDGEILFDGKPLHDLDLGSVREQIGAVVQNGQLMRGTVIENILGGMKGNERTAWDGAKAAALDDDIRAMPMKMHTLVDPQLISGGQAQRILLARALVRRPPIVLLDEATSALDNIAQATVTRSLDQLGATRIVIAHRLSTIKSADRIIVMNRGQIVQSGTYDELMSQHGEFSRLANRQLL